MIINTTPHDVIVVGTNGTKVYKKAENPARLVTTEKVIGELEGTPCVKTEFGKSINLPDAEKDVWLIVSQIIKNAMPERMDLIVPCNLIRDENGLIVGCKAWQV